MSQRGRYTSIVANPYFDTVADTMETLSYSSSNALSPSTMELETVTSSFTVSPFTSVSFLWKAFFPQHLKIEISLIAPH